jgi:hypothetical protein
MKTVFSLCLLLLMFTSAQAQTQPFTIVSVPGYTFNPAPNDTHFILPGVIVFDNSKNRMVHCEVNPDDRGMSCTKWLDLPK